MRAYSGMERPDTGSFIYRAWGKVPVLPISNPLSESGGGISNGGRIHIFQYSMSNIQCPMSNVQCSIHLIGDDVVGKRGDRFYGLGNSDGGGGDGGGVGNPGHYLSFDHLSFNLIFNFLLPGAALGVGIIGGIWAVSKGKAMGFGDVEIAAVLGFWLGAAGTLVALWMAFVLGGFAGGWLLAAGKRKLKSQIAFGPFLVI